MQINIDVVVHMKCQDIHINVQDSSGDRILAAKRLQEDPTNWQTWADARGVHKLNHDKHGRIDTGAGWLNAEATEEGFGEEHVHDIVALGKKRAKWARTPRPRGEPDSCRIFGSLELNKVQGDFHITARGHGYMEMGGGSHLDHSRKYPVYVAESPLVYLTQLQSSTFRTLSRSCRLANSTRRSSTRLIRLLTLLLITSTSSSTTCLSYRRCTQSAGARFSQTSTL